MKTIKTDVEVDGKSGKLELRELSLRDMMPHMKRMEKGGDDALFDILDAVAYLNGKPLKNASKVISGKYLTKIIPLITEIAGLDSGGEEEGND